jgi:GPI-anchor transamidase subunit K
MLLSRCGRRNGKCLDPPSLPNWVKWLITVSDLRYHELLFMIDTCQANTMYSKLYSPNIIATGSSEIHQSSYSHHADNDVGVAVIDRYTYYNLDYLETQVTDPTSKKTLGDLFDSYDEGKIHSHPGLRWDLLKGGEQEGRNRLVMDFFGNVQNVEIEDKMAGYNAEQWKEDLEALRRLIESAQQRGNHTLASTVSPDVDATEAKSVPRDTMPGVAKVQKTDSWTRQAMGTTVLLGCAGAWLAASWLEKKG